MILFSFKEVIFLLFQYFQEKLPENWVKIVKDTVNEIFIKSILVIQLKLQNTNGTRNSKCLPYINDKLLKT